MFMFRKGSTDFNGIKKLSLIIADCLSDGYYKKYGVLLILFYYVLSFLSVFLSV